MGATPSLLFPMTFHTEDCFHPRPLRGIDSDSAKYAEVALFTPSRLLLAQGHAWLLAGTVLNDGVQMTIEFVLVSFDSHEIIIPTR